MSHTWSPGGLVMPGHQHLILNSLLQLFLHTFTQIFCLFISKRSWLQLGSSSAGCELAVSHLSTALVSLGSTHGSGWQHWQLQWTGKVVLRERFNGFCPGRCFHAGDMHFSCYSSYVISHPTRKHRFTIAYLRREGVS